MSLAEHETAQADCAEGCTDHATCRTDSSQPQLGLATTRQILDELLARYTVGDAGSTPTLDLDYSTVGGERGMHLEDSNLVAHAERELRLSGQTAEDPGYAASIVRAVKEFASYGHSGGSAPLAVEQLHRLLKGEPLSPLTSDSAEWEDRSAESGTPMWQNRRDSRAFSEDGGKTWWYVDARHPGERCKDGGEWGVLEKCHECSGQGLMHRPDELPAAPTPTDKASA